MEDLTKYKQAVCIAGGVGITPFLSHISYLADMRYLTDFSFLLYIFHISKFFHLISSDKEYQTHNNDSLLSLEEGRGI